MPWREYSGPQCALFIIVKHHQKRGKRLRVEEDPHADEVEEEDSKHSVVAVRQWLRFWGMKVVHRFFILLSVLREPNAKECFISEKEDIEEMYCWMFRQKNGKILMNCGY